MKVNNKFLSEKLALVVSIMLIFNLSSNSLDGETLFNRNIEKWIKIAKKINEMESFFATQDENYIISHLKVYLKDDESRIRKIAVEKLGEVGDTSVIEELESLAVTDQVWFVRQSARFSKTLIELKSKSDTEIREHLTILLKTDHGLAEAVTEEFLRNSWIQDLEQISNKLPRLKAMVDDKRERRRIISELKSLPKNESIRKAVNLLTNWEFVAEYEEAILTLVEIGKKATPEILELLNNEANIPKTSPPPWEKNHTNYNIILKALKSIPDKGAVNKLEKLSLRKEEYVSKLAKDALRWINTGVPYPFKYERILLIAEDDIPPYEKKK